MHVEFSFRKFRKKQLLSWRKKEFHHMQCAGCVICIYFYNYFINCIISYSLVYNNTTYIHFMILFVIV